MQRSVFKDLQPPESQFDGIATNIYIIDTNMIVLRGAFSGLLAVGLP